MLQDLSTVSLAVGYQMNLSKTQILTNGAKRRVEEDGLKIHLVDQYTYWVLGRFLRDQAGERNRPQD